MPTERGGLCSLASGVSRNAATVTSGETTDARVTAASGEMLIRSGDVES
jgi:hypothetical protein